MSPSHPGTFKRMSVGPRASLLGFACLLLGGHLTFAQATPSKSAATASPTKPAAEIAPALDAMAGSYYHSMLAHGYAEQAISGGRPEMATQAISEYKLALAANPSSAELSNALAELYFRTGQVKQAIESAKAQIARDPNSLPAHKLLGRIYLRSLGSGAGDTGQGEMLQLAIAEYTKIISLEPNDIEDHLLLGQLYSFSKQPAKAKEEFALAQKINPHSEEVALNMARIDTEQHNPRGAIQVLTSLPAEDQTAKTQYALGASYDQIKDTKKAIAAYQKSLALEPENLDVERSLAEALHNVGQDKEALSAYLDIIDGDPTDANAYLRAAEIERRQGDARQALAHLKKAAPLASDSLEIRYNEAQAYEQLGEYSEAERLLSKMVADATHSTGDYSPSEKNNYALFLDHLANVYEDQGRTDEAVSTYEKMIALGDDYALNAYGGQVDAYQQGHQYDKATAIIRKALLRFPDNRGLKLALANQLANSGKLDEGVSQAKGLLNNTPQDRQVYLTLSQIYLNARKWKNSGEALDKAEKLSVTKPEQLVIYLQQGMLADRQKRYDVSEDSYKKALAIDPENSTVLNDYGYMLADRNIRLNEALAMIQKAVKIDPGNYANLDSLGWTYFKLGQYTLAENNLMKASQRSALDPTVHEHLGDLYEKTGRLKQAASQWEESLRLFQKTESSDTEPGEGARLEKKLDSARVRLARENPQSTGNDATDKHP